MRVIGPGATGEDVRDVQSRLGALGFRIEPEEHGTYGPSTQEAVRAFQQHRHLLVDGLVGVSTWEELVEAGHALGDRVLYLRYPFFRGDDVRALQGRLNLLGFDAGREDGIFGERTDRAIREFQRNIGVGLDGIVGPGTLQHLLRLRPVGAGPGRAAVREGEILLRLSATLDGARVAIDAGHGRGDQGVTGPTGLPEAEAGEALARALLEELRLRGADPFALREPGENPPEGERARRANEAGAELLVSVHLNAHTDPAAEGASTYYYGRGDYVSRAGQRLAELIQEELTTRLGLKDGRSHPKALPLLRETRMPAVHVEPCFITNPKEEALLRDEPFRREVAMALGDALERFLGGRRRSASVALPPPPGTAGGLPGAAGVAGGAGGAGQGGEPEAQRGAEQGRPEAP